MEACRSAPFNEPAVPFGAACANTPQAKAVTVTIANAIIFMRGSLWLRGHGRRRRLSTRYQMDGSQCPPHLEMAVSWSHLCIRRAHRKSALGAPAFSAKTSAAMRPFLFPDAAIVQGL